MAEHNEPEKTVGHYRLFAATENAARLPKR